ncbi:hypothetical protein [Euzebya sp.]|uniref:hypothetical protein n=1 Tax=Euzebya sp. TaxID=1971409 RepID=UPI0035150F36
MDSDELDQWLDGDDDRADRWPPTTADRSSGAATRRPPWRLLGAAGGVVWLGVMAVVFLGGQDSPVATAPSADPTGLVVEVPASDGVAAPTSPDAPPPTATAAPPTETAEVASDGPMPPPGIHAGAIAALRDRLTTQGTTTSYLEWATPVTARPLDAGVWLVVLDAIWLEGADGALSTSHRQRWAVAVADDGRALSPPWPAPAPDPPDPSPTMPPPTGEVRLAEIARVLTESGWTSVTPVASDPHELLPGVLVALVDATAPGAATASTHVVWLEDGPDGGLIVVGAQP